MQLSGMLRLLKQHNLSWRRIRTVLSDKDFTERAVYKQHFSDANLQICLFHVLRSMKREINAGKMNITQEQRHTCLEIIQK